MQNVQTEKISLVNGRIHTPLGLASGLTFEHGRINSITNTNSASNLGSDSAAHDKNGKVIDLHGRTVLPGFCDGSADFLRWAEHHERLQLDKPQSSKSVYDALNAFARANSKPLRGWYIVDGPLENIEISRSGLDSVISDKPCVIFDENSRRAIINTSALNASGLAEDTPELTEITQHIPGLSGEDIVFLIRNYAAKIPAMGITELWIEISGEKFSKVSGVFLDDAYDLMPFRLRCNVKFNSVASLNEFLASGLRTGDGRPMCRIGAAVIDSNIDPHEQKNMIYQAHMSGMQVICEWNKTCLNILERASRRFRKTNLRHLILNPAESAFERMRISGFGGIVNEKSDSYVNLHSAFQNGLAISFGSSKNSIQPPLKNIGELLSEGPSASISMAEALSLYTWDAAWNGRTENRRGELTIGNDADFVILERDPFIIHPEELEHVDVTMTFCAGRAVYDSGLLV